ncbi:MAG TPA: type II secretion system protein [Phycisphaerae bacterium]|jgi:prepilin-type N-terminal cleavage/methylation domain-containing protein
MRKICRGFTLFELVLVVLILGIIAASLIPPINNNIRSPRLKTAANVLAADIEFCESECIAQPNAPRVITFSILNNTYTLLDFNAGTAIKNPGDGLAYVNDFATGRNAQLNGVTVTSVVSGGSAISSVTFNSYGKPLLTADLVITLSYNSQTLTLTVNAGTGDISIAGG